MPRIFLFLPGLLLLGLGWAAQAQTTPAGHPPPVKPRTRPHSAPAHKGVAYGAPLIQDTAAFRRSGRPADAVPVPPRPKE